MMLIILFQRYSLWLFLLLSALVGLALAHLTSTVFETVNQSPVEFSRRETADLPEVPRKNTLANYQPIVRRNIFNSAENASSAEDSDKPRQRTARTSTWTLVGTISGGSMPLATLRDKNGVDTYALGARLPDGARLKNIERQRVELDYDAGKAVVVELEDPFQPEPAPPSRRPAADNRPDIIDLGQNRWEIPALLADNARANIGELLKQAQAVPYLEAGVTTGFELKMIRRNSLIAQLGLKRGDILRRVNGIALDSPEKALQIFGQLRQAEHITIDLERRGKVLSFAYQIR